MRERIPHAPLGKIPMAFRQPLLSEQGPECSEGVVEPHHCRHARAVLHDRALLDLAGKLVVFTCNQRRPVLIDHVRPLGPQRIRIHAAFSIELSIAAAQ